MQNLTLNWSVVLSLALSLFVSMAILHTGNAAYSTVDAAHWAFDDSAWSDLASYAWPEDLDAQAALRRGLYIGECVTVCLAILMCISGLTFILILYTAFGAALPDMPSKLDFMLSHPMHCTLMWGVFDNLMFLVPLSLGFITARSSAVLSFSCFATFGVYQLIMLGLVNFGVPGNLARAQQVQVRRVVATIEAQAARASAAPGEPAVVTATALKLVAWQDNGA